MDALINVPPGTSLDVRVFLQRVLTGWSAGHHEVPWTIAVACVGANHTKTGLARGAGTLRFDITPGSSAPLSSVFERFMRELETGNAFQQREAVEALTTSSSPAVIEYLERLPALGYRQQAFDALAKFAGEPRARQFVMSAVRSSNGPSVIAALR